LELMKTQKGLPTSMNLGEEKTGDLSKLVSLLALAAGAAAMPQRSDATVIYDNNGGTVSFSALHSFVLNNFPGTARIGFQENRRGSFTVTSKRSIVGGQKSGYVAIKAAWIPASQHPVWSQIVASTRAAAFAMATATYSHHNPDLAGHQYLAFKFEDSTAGNAMRYGWIDITLNNGDLIGGGEGPSMTIYGWAYDTTGAQLGAGLVPEPSSMSLMALGALALGAKGVGSWRRNRASTKS
jgi:hypothetical protein